MLIPALAKELCEIERTSVRRVAVAVVTADEVSDCFKSCGIERAAQVDDLVGTSDPLSIACLSP